VGMELKMSRVSLFGMSGAKNVAKSFEGSSQKFNFISFSNIVLDLIVFYLTQLV
jgi:hypothetical protein